MNRAEVVRNTIVDSWSPLEKHSMNQERLRLDIHGQQRIETPRKIKMSESRKERLKKENDEHQLHKLKRITERVKASFNGYDGFDVPTLFAEIRHLRNHGICIGTILSQKPKPPEGLI